MWPIDRSVAGLQYAASCAFRGASMASRGELEAEAGSPRRVLRDADSGDGRPMTGRLLTMSSRGSGGRALLEQPVPRTSCLVCQT
jgi:hypothetical protein